MIRYIKKYKAAWIAVFIGFVCFLGWGTFSQERQNTNGIVSSYEQFQGEVYDEERLEPMDMTLLLDKWKNRMGQDVQGSVMDAGWVCLSDSEDGDVRYYVDNRRYLLGWQYLEKNGVWDWYYFAEDTGYMVTDTILDGVVLSQDGYATAVTATTEKTLHCLKETGHCREVLIKDGIRISEPVEVSRDLLIVSNQNKSAKIESKAILQGSVIEVSDQAVLTLASNVEVSAKYTSQNGIHIKDAGVLLCYGTIGDTVKQKSEDESRADFAVKAEGENAQVYLYPGAMITGADIGIYSSGNTILLNDDGTSAEYAKRFRLQDVLSGLVVHAATMTSGQTITGNTSNGIVQDGGTLTMSGGLIYGNGKLGGYGVEGSYGGGVHLKNGAVMNMSGGTISANCAAYGGGIYVNADCTLNLSGGTIGGTRLYDPDGTNTSAAGNYARENRTSSNALRYAKGGGGGICSFGTVNANVTSNLTIAYNCTEGSVGGAGVLIADGLAMFSGNTVIHHNQAYASACKGTLWLSGNDDKTGEGAGIRLGLEESGYEARCYVNCLNEEEFPEVSGSLVIRDNTASGDGGGIFISSGTYNQLVTKGNTDIYNNTSQADGGGGVKTNGGALFLYGTDIYTNTAEDGAGGGVAGAGVVDLETCNIYSNTATEGGGGVTIFASEEGVTGDGYVHGSIIYNNTSGSGGSGVEVIDKSTVRIQGGSQIYNNQSPMAGIYCETGSALMLGLCDTYGNSGYGLYNQGYTEVEGTVTLGFSSYESTSAYTAAPNEGGGICNGGTLLVSDSKIFYVYGGEKTALKNTGTATFHENTCNVFYAKNAESIILNQGTITANGKGFFNAPIVAVAGDNVQYGLNNAGGILSWGGTVKGNYEITDTSMKKGAADAGIGIGIYNHDGGDVSLTGGDCYDCETYGVYCQTGSSLHMSGSAVIDTDNVVFLEQDCCIDINGKLTATDVVAKLDTMANKDRNPGRIMAKVTYADGNGADELYDDAGEERFLLNYEQVDEGTIAFLLDGSNISGVTDAVAQTISEADIYLSTVIEEQLESQLEAWLYDRSGWLRNQMTGSKKDEQYQHFLAGDMGIITFTSVNLTEVSILWPTTGGLDELKTYDATGTCVNDGFYKITDLTEDISQIYENSSYQFQVPPGTPEGIYYVTVIGKNDAGEEISCILPVSVGDKTIAGTFRTRIR